MAERIIAVRHFQEQDNLLYLNDSPVMETELPKAISVASEISDRAREGGFSQIHILTSSKKRTEVTAVEVAKEIGTTFPVTIRIDGRIRTIDQGKYILPEGYKPGDYFQPLQDAWAIFLEETFGEGNLWYRFGDPVTNVDGTCKYPQLVGHFDKYGENQIEFSLRFYSFLVDLCRKYKDQIKRMSCL